MAQTPGPGETEMRRPVPPTILCYPHTPPESSATGVGFCPTFLALEVPRAPGPCRRTTITSLPPIYPAYSRAHPTPIVPHCLRGLLCHLPHSSRDKGCYTQFSGTTVFLFRSAIVVTNGYPDRGHGSNGWMRSSVARRTRTGHDQSDTCPQ